MKTRNWLVILLSVVITLALMIYVPYVMLSPDAGLAAIAIISPFAFFPYNHFTSLLFTFVSTTIIFLLYRRWTNNNLTFWRSLVYSIIIVQSVIAIYNLYDYSVVEPKIQEYNRIQTENFESEKINRVENKSKLYILHTTFGEILKNQAVNRCAELERLRNELSSIIENADFYVLYSEENCKKILQGDYAFFSKLALEKDKYQKEKEAFPFMLEARESAWLSIFNAFGYEHCMDNSQFSIAPTRTFEPPDGSYFGQLEKKQIPFSNFCNLKQAITTKDLAYCDQMKGDDFFSRDSCIRELAFVKQEPTLCDSGFEGTRRALDANRKNVPWTYDDEYQEHIVYFMNKIIAECKNPWLPLRAYAVTSDDYAEKFSILAEDIFHADPWRTPGFKGFD